MAGVKTHFVMKPIHIVSLLIIVLNSNFSVLNAQVQECGPLIVTLEDTSELTAEETKILTTNGPLILNSDDVSNVTLQYNGNSQEDILVETFLNPDDSTTEIIFKVGPTLKTFLETVRPPDETYYSLSFQCGSNQYPGNIVEIKVLDENNNPPIWNEVNLQYTIPSSMPTTIPLNWDDDLYTSDKDYDESNAQLAITIETGFESQIRVDTKPKWSGGRPPTYDYDVQIFLEESNSLETGIEHSISITASDGVNDEILQLSLTINPSVEPKFPQVLYEHNIPSLPVPAGTEIDEVIRAEVDENAQIVYTIESDLVDYLDYDSGTNKFSFNREITEQDIGNEFFHTVKIKASVDGGAGVTYEDNAVLTIRYPDSDREVMPPVFSEPSYSIEIMEDTKLGDQIEIQIAFTPPVSNPSIEVVDADNLFTFFEDDTSGDQFIVVAVEPNPSEHADPAQNYMRKSILQASIDDGQGGKVQSSTTLIVYYPIPKDDELLPPVFHQPTYNIVIDENAQADDRIPIDIQFTPDIPDVTIEIIDNDNLFGFNSTGGQNIVLLVDPDPSSHADKNYIRESTIRASIDDGNGGTLSSDASLIVYYPIPIGEELLPPVFHQPTYNIVIDENAQADDKIPINIQFTPDIPDVTIEIIDNDNLFGFDPTGGQNIVLLVDPDPSSHADKNYIRESTIRASIDDGNGGTLSSDASLIVYYPIPIGEELLPPVFHLPTYSIVIDENAQADDKIPIDIQFTPDIPDVTIEIIDNDNLFGFDPTSGQHIVLLVDPDPSSHADKNYIRESTIRASIDDGNGGTLSSDASLIVYYPIPIEGELPPPQFAQPSYTITIDENTQQGDTLPIDIQFQGQVPGLTIEVVDDDNLFSFDDSSGSQVIVVEVDPNPTEHADFNFVRMSLIRATIDDGIGGRQQSEASLVIRYPIPDDFEIPSPPQFTEPSYTITIDENTQQGDTLPIDIQFDGQVPGLVIEVVDDDDLFRFDDTSGSQVIVVEVDPNPSEHADSNFIRMSVIRATIDDGIGGTLQSETSLVVRYPPSSDGDPLPPQFEDPSYSIEIDNSFPIGHRVPINIRVVPPIPEVSIEIVDPDDLFTFVIQDNNQFIELLKEPDPSHPDQNFIRTSTIKASIDDGNGGTLSSETSLIIYYEIPLDDVAVKPPVFESPIYDFLVPSNAQEGTTISVDIQASSIPPLDVTYSLANEDLLEITQVSPTNGISELTFKTTPSDDDYAGQNFIYRVEITASVTTESETLTGKTVLLARFTIDSDECPPGDDDDDDSECDDDCSNTAFIVIIVVLSILFIGATGVGAYFFWKLRKSTSSALSPETSSPIDKPFSFGNQKPAEVIRRTSILKSPVHKDSLKDNLIDDSDSTSEQIATRSNSHVEITNEAVNKASLYAEKKDVDTGLKPSLKAPKEIEKDYLDDGDEDLIKDTVIEPVIEEAPKKGVVFSGEAEVEVFVKDDDEGEDFVEKL